jgi:uncharacterized membrane protein
MCLCFEKPPEDFFRSPATHYAAAGFCVVIFWLSIATQIASMPHAPSSLTAVIHLLVHASNGLGVLAIWQVPGKPYLLMLSCWLKAC